MTRTHRSTAFQLHGISMWSNWILYQRSTAIAFLEVSKLVGGKPLPCLRTRLTAPPLPSCYASPTWIYRELTAPTAPRAAHPAYPLLKLSHNCGVLQSTTDQTPLPGRTALTNISPPTASETNGLAQNLPIPRASSKKLQSRPRIQGMAFLTCLHHPG
jgi:hypothetical protein